MGIYRSEFDLRSLHSPEGTLQAELTVTYFIFFSKKNFSTIKSHTSKCGGKRQ